MTTRAIFMILMLLVSLAAGCAGKEEMVNLRIYDLPTVTEKVGADLKVAVEPFEDMRPNKERLGSRTHLGGGKTYFNFMGGHLGTGGAEAFIAFLNSHGFQAFKAGAGSPDADVTIKAVVRKFRADANSTFMNTHLESDATTEFHITNHADSSKVRLTIGSGGTDDELIFDVEDMEDLVNTALQKGFEEFLDNVKIEGNTLRKKF